MMSINPDTGYSDAAFWSLIPLHCHSGLAAYFTFGQPVGSFLNAILSNDLIGAAMAADHLNCMALYSYADFLHNCADPRSYGSPAKVRDWIDGGGAHGRLSRHE